MTRKKSSGPRKTGGETGFTMAKLRKVAGPRVLLNAEPLVNSPHLLKRIKDGTELSGTFYGYGSAITCSVSARRHALQELCTCSANYFCRHAAALVQTFMEFPDTFLDLEAYLEGLVEAPRDDLVDMLRHLIGRYPGSSLEALGQEGFDPAEVLDEADDDLLLGDAGDLFAEENGFLGEYGEPELEHPGGPVALEDLDDFDDFDDPGSRGNLN